MLPTAAAGAAKESSLNFYRTAQERLMATNATGYSTIKNTTKHAIYEKSLNLKGMLEGVGHDLFSVLDKSIKFSERSSGALSSAFIAMTDIHKNPVAALYSQRHGSTPAPGGGKPPRRQVVQDLAKDIYRSNKTKLNQVDVNKPLQGTQIDSMLDLIPGYKAVRQGAKTAHEEYQKLSFAQSFLDKPGTNWNKINDGFAKILGADKATTEGARLINASLGESILNIQRKRSSDVFSLLREFDTKTGGRSASTNFIKMLRQGAYKDRLEKQLINDGLDESVAKQFSRNLTVSDDIYREIAKRDGGVAKAVISPTERLRMGDEEIVGEDFFGQLITRFNSGKYVKNNPIPDVFDADKLRRSVNKVDRSLFSQTLKEDTLNVGINIDSAHSSAREVFEKEVFSSVLKPRKLNRIDFEGAKGEVFQAKLEMAKRAGKVFGLDESILANPDELAKALGARGIDIRNASQLRGYLMNNKEMVAGPTSGLAGVFGLEGLTVDRFLEREKLAYQTITDQIGPGSLRDSLTKNILGGDSAELEILNAIKRSSSQTTLSNVKGYYTLGNKVVNFNPIRSGIRKVTEALATETKVPIIGINPMQMLGYKDFAGMAKAGRYQVTSGAASQPFVKGSKADFYTWHSTGGFLGTKGILYGHTDGVAATALEGTYRPLPTSVSSMFTSTAELAAGERTVQSRTATGFLGKVRERLDYADEQPNSLFRFFGRLVNRQADVENDAVMARLISGNVDETFSVGGFGRKKNLQLRAEPELDDATKAARYSLLDADSGAQVASHSQLM